MQQYARFAMCSSKLVSQWRHAWYDHRWEGKARFAHFFKSHDKALVRRTFDRLFGFNKAHVPCKAQLFLQGTTKIWYSLIPFWHSSHRKGPSSSWRTLSAGHTEHAGVEENSRKAIRICLVSSRSASSDHRPCKKGEAFHHRIDVQFTELVPSSSRAEIEGPMPWDHFPCPKITPCPKIACPINVSEKTGIRHTRHCAS